MLDIENYENLFELNDTIENPPSLNLDLIEKLRLKAKNLVKLKTSVWKKEIKALNHYIFKKEIIKKEKIYSHRKRLLKLKLESLKKTLERQEKKKPTEKQLQNIEKLTDQQKKNERIEKAEQLEEQIGFIKKDIKKIEKDLDDLTFEFDDLNNEMKKRNLAKFYTNLDSFAIIQINN
jgi:hypothetical protein